MPKFKLEEFLLPWEYDGKGNKLDEPKEIDVEQLRKYVYGLLTDKEEAQEARDTAVAEKENAQNDLTELRQKNESDEERRVREQKERDAEFEKLRQEGVERRKIDALAEAYPEATAARIKRLAKRVTGDEKDWLSDAKELVEDGFKLSDKPAEERPANDDTDDVSSRPKPRRSNGEPVKTAAAPKTIAEELEAAGIGRSNW